LIEADEDEPDGALAEIQLADLLPKPFDPSILPDRRLPR
jgi:hypothetical protein